MTKDTFLHEWKGQIFHIGAWTLYSRPTQIVNEDTGEELDFNSKVCGYCGAPNPTYNDGYHLHKT